jgi:hypothetical protein
MAIVAIAAFDLTMIRVYGDYRTTTGDLLLVGFMPMANVLAVGILALTRRSRSRAFLAGFEVFGLSALMIFIYLAEQLPEKILMPYAGPVVMYLYGALGRYGILVCLPAICSTAATMLTVPQIAFALVGGVIFRKAVSSMTPRESLT